MMTQQDAIMLALLWSVIGICVGYIIALVVHRR